jgi:hypothetical protein
MKDINLKDVKKATLEYYDVLTQLKKEYGVLNPL